MCVRAHVVWRNISRLTRKYRNTTLRHTNPNSKRPNKHSQIAALLLVVALLNWLVYGALVVISMHHTRTRRIRAMRTLDKNLRNEAQTPRQKRTLRRRLYHHDEFKATDIPRFLVQRVRHMIAKPLTAEVKIYFLFLWMLLK